MVYGTEKVQKKELDMDGRQGAASLVVALWAVFYFLCSDHQDKL